LLIFFDSNIFNIEKPSEILVIDTKYKNFYKKFSDNENIKKDKTISDLINYQFDSIINIIQKNIKIKNIIFITYESICSISYNENKPVINSEDIIYDQNITNKSIEIDGVTKYLDIKINKQFINWLIDYSQIISNYNLYWLSTDLNLYQNSEIKINIVKNNNESNILKINQYIIGTIENNNNNINAG
jgi:hypothetical protein